MCYSALPDSLFGRTSHQRTGFLTRFNQCALPIFTKLVAFHTFNLDAPLFVVDDDLVAITVHQRCRDKGSGTIGGKAHSHPATADTENLGFELFLILCSGGQVAHVEPVFDIALGKAVESTALGQLLCQCLGSLCRWLLALQYTFDQAMVDHVAILADRGGPGGISRQTQAEMRPGTG